MNGRVVDIDECTENKNTTCTDNAKACVNSAGSFKCTCLDGFEFKNGACTGITPLYSTVLSAS